jgi:hypothetical protein
MIQLLQLIMAPYVDTFSAFLVYNVSLAAAGAWWRRQISFGWGSDRASSQISIGTPEQWFNLVLLLIALSLFTYFMIASVCRARRSRLQKAAQARNAT